MSVVPKLASLFVVLNLSAATVHAVTNVWSGASLTDADWSTGGNWSGLAVPGVADAVEFLDVGTAVGAGTVNNVVDGSFAGTIGSLQYANQSGFHTTELALGKTLNVTGPGGLTVGTLAEVPAGITILATINGRGVVNVNNTSGNLVVQQSASGSGSPRATLDLSGLDLFIANVNRVGIGTSSLLLSAAANQRLTGTLYLAKTNFLTAAHTSTLATYLAAGANNALEVGKNTGNPAGMNFLHLGQENVLCLDSIAIGREKSSTSFAAWMGFNPAFTNQSPTAIFRGVGGGSSRIKWWAIGDMNTTGSTAQTAVGTCDFSNGSVDAWVDVLSLGRDCNASHTATAANSGTLTFTAGTIDVNTLIAGNQSLGLAGNIPANLGVVNVKGSNATLIVNSNLVLGYTTQDSVAATNTGGTINLNNGTLRANRITVGERSANNSIVVNGGRLTVSNTIASPAKGLTTLSLSDATIELNVTGVTNVVTSSLVTGGSTNVLKLHLASFSSFPTQLTLIKYSGAISGAGYNFGFGTNALPNSAPGAYLSNNVANQSVDLVLPSGPRPVIVNQPVSRLASVGDDVSFAVGVSGESATPLSYRWHKGGTPITDGPSGNGSTYLGATAAILSISGVQLGDSGDFSVLVTNLYGAETSSLASLTVTTGNVPPYVLGPTNLTVIQGSNATFSASVSGMPVPGVQWRKNNVDIPGANASLLTITNAQFPADQATYTIIATNSSGAATNSATLTVIAPPVITSQPQSLTVVHGQSANFAVSATSQAPLTYQWWKNGSLLSDATNSTLSFASAYPSDAGTYVVVVANLAGAVASSNAVLTVNPAATSTLPGPLDYFVDPNCASAFPTIQSAHDAISGQSPSNRANIFIAPGTYTELVNVTKPDVSLIGLGESPSDVFITFSGAQLFTPTVTIAAEATGFMARNVTFDNAFPDRNAIQTLAVRTSADRVIFDRCRFLSYQDTLLTDGGRSYFYDCFITGDTDFIYGEATDVFERCTIESTDRGYITAVNTAKTTANGAVFLDCTLVSGTDRHAYDDGSTAANDSVFLGRPWQWDDTNTVMSSAIFIRTKMGLHIRIDGWNPWDLAGQPNTNPDAVCRYSEFGSMDLSGNLLPVDGNGVPIGRVSWADPMTAAQAANYTIANIFGGASTVPLWNTPGSQPEGTGQTYIDTRAPWNPLEQLALIPVPAWRPLLGQPARMGDGSVQFSISGVPCRSYRVWASSNVALTPVTSTWTQLGSGTFGDTPTSFTDTSAMNYPTRFYIVTMP